MKVLQLISSTGYYGAEAVVVNLSKQLEKLGVSNTIGVFQNAHRPNLEVAEVAKQQRLRVEILPCAGRMDWGCVRRIRDRVRGEGFDVLHTHGYKAHLYGYLAVRAISCPVVATCHGYRSVLPPGLARLRQQFYGAVERALLRRFDRVVAVSSELAEALGKARVASGKLTIIRNGVDPDGFGSACPSADLEKIKGGRMAVGLVGRLTEGKGHRQLFQAAREILVRHPNTVLFVVGDGPLKSRLEDLARELGIASSVFFTGKRSDMVGVYAALDIFVLPSLYEGLPMVILEALAAKRAVIATRVGAVPDLILEGNTGLLIEPADIPALGNAMIRLMTDAGLRRSLGENGAAFVRKQFSAQSMAGKYLELYQAVVAR